MYKINWFSKAQTFWHIIFGIAFFSLLTSCLATRNALDSNGVARSLGDPKNAQSFGYQPIDPLPVKVVDERKDSGKISYTKSLMNSLPDETMRLAIGEVDLQSNITFGPAKLGYENGRYVVILDYMKFDTKSIASKFVIDKGENAGGNRKKADTIKFIPIQAEDANPDAVVPVYVGVGLRLTATLTVNKGTVDLGNLFALGAAAEAKKITGTLVIQTLGISGENISSLIPMPNQINTTTIQNAILALGAMKARIYQDDIRVTPRILGFYNTVGGGQATTNTFISTCLSSEKIPHPVE